jgi:ribosomal protein S18 acetylase RimI-like enzyme
MPHNYRLRRAVPEDLERLVAYTVAEAREAEGVGKDPAAVRRGVLAGLEDPSVATYWLAVSEGGETAASTSVVREWSDWHGGYYWWIQSLYIAPGHRGRGLVEQILDELSRKARDAGAVDLRLYAHNSNRRALHVYSRCGFQTAPYTIMTRSLRDPDGEA